MIMNLINKAITSADPRLLSLAMKYSPRAISDWKKYSTFQHYVKYAYKYSPFYRRKFDSLGIDPDIIKKPSDLGNFYTTPMDIVEHAEEFICRKPNIVFESSGTTGRNKRVYLSNQELRNIGTFNAAGMFLGGVTKEDRLVNGFDFCIWIPGMITQKGIEGLDAFGMAAGKVDPVEVYKRLGTYKFNIVLGEPTWLIKLTELAEKHGSFPLKYIIAGAEEMPDAARPWMEKVWQGPKIRMVYASVESAGILGFEAFGECKGYHIDENSFLVEIADANEDGYGEVTYTTLTRDVMPLIRYRNRDISKIIEEPCGCGLAFRRLARMRGRADELIVASGGNLYPLMFEDILKDVNGITSDWQIVFKLEGIKEIMEFNLEVREGVSKDEIEKNIFENIKVRYPDLWKNYSIAIFKIAFTYHLPQALRAGKHKLLRIVDNRYFQK